MVVVVRPVVLVDHRPSVMLRRGTGNAANHGEPHGNPGAHDWRA
jgi:hypothetical protein